MRAPFLLLPITLALAAPLASLAQDSGPRVLFCAGECFAVDAKGTRSPAPKGTQLRLGQRLETGPGGYAQVKLSPEAAVGIGEQARVGFDRDAVVLDQGRIRMVGGETFGKPIGRPVELRTTDGTVVLRGGDLEARKTGLGTAAAATLVRLTAGDARLGKGAGEIQLPPQAVQGIERGKLAGAPIPITDIVPPRRGTDVPVATGPVALPTAPIAIAPSRIEPTTTLVLSPTLTTSLSTSYFDKSLSTTTTYTKTYEPVLTSAEKLLTSTFTTTTGTTATFNDILKTTTATTTTTTDTSKLLLDSSTSLKTIDSSYTLVKEPTLCSTCLKLQTTTTFTR
jgi:hypothetical protein